MITFKKQNDGLSGVLPGEDHISGLLVYGTAPVAWAGGTGITTRQIGSVKQAEDFGITAAGSTTKVWHYHISEFFRIQPNSLLWVGIFPAPATANDYTFQEIRTIQNAADGKIRQIGVYVTIPLATAQINTLEGVYDDLFEDDYSPLAIVYAPDIQSVSDLATLTDLRTLAAENVSVVIGQDGGAKGKILFDDVDKSISCLGALIGTISRASVNENIGWIEQFDVAETELDVPAFANGQLFKALTKAQIEAIGNKGYIFLKKERGIGGTYFNDSPTCVSATNDFNRIERNRTIDKAVRGVRASLLPQQNAPVLIDAATGKLAPEAIAYFNSLANRPIQQMERDGELSGYSVFIDPDQNFLTQGKLTVSIKNVPLGVVFNFDVNIGFANKV
jgi:hypothetical protein